MIKKISCLIFAVFMLFYCTACSGNKLNLLDFEDKTVDAELGSFFSIEEYLSVQDDKGNTYEASYTVKTTSGTAVSTIGNKFKVDKIEGYKLSLTIEKNSRAITINVVDTTAPTIRIGELRSSYGYVGNKYELPHVDYFDLSETVENSKTIKVYSLEGEEKQFLEIDDEQCFIPTKEATYYIEATCEDIYGNVGTAQKEFIVRKYAEDNEVEYFSDKKSIDSFVVDYAGSGIEGGFVKWLDEYDGENGVIQVKFRSNHATDMGFFYSFIPRLKMEDYHGTKLIMRIFVPAESSVSYLQLGAGAYRSQVNVSKGEWKDYVFDYAVFENLWTIAEKNPELKLSEVNNYFAIFLSKVGEGCIYIDKILVEDELANIENKDNGSNDIIFD